MTDQPSQNVSSRATGPYTTLRWPSGVYSPVHDMASKLSLCPALADREISQEKLTGLDDWLDAVSPAEQVVERLNTLFSDHMITWTDLTSIYAANRQVIQEMQTFGGAMHRLIYRQDRSDEQKLYDHHLMDMCWANLEVTFREHRLLWTEDGYVSSETPFRLATARQMARQG